MTQADPDYQKLIEDGVQVIGIWDDHDFGNNNGGKEFARKGIYREMFLDFLGELGTPRRD
jgi:alkaline phosphatase D